MPWIITINGFKNVCAKFYCCIPNATKAACNFVTTWLKNGGYYFADRISVFYNVLYKFSSRFYLETVIIVAMQFQHKVTLVTSR